MTIDSQNSVRRHERVERDGACAADSARGDLSRQVQKLFDHPGNSSRMPETASRYLPPYANERDLNKLASAERGVPGEQSRFGGVVDQLRQHRTRLLLDASAPPEHRLAAVRELANAGTNNLTVKGNDGQPYKLRLETEKAGSREMVHMYLTGADGKEHTVLRGVADQKGEFTREQDKRGNQVGWYGSGAAQLQNILGSDSPDLQRRTVRGENLHSLKDRAPQIDPLDRRIDQVPRDQTQNGDPHRQNPYNDNRRNPHHRQNNEQFAPPLDGRNERPVPRPLDQPSDQNGRQWLDRAALDARNQTRQLVQTTAGIYLRSGMTVDADGSPRARQIDPTGQVNTSMRYADNKSVNAEVVPYMVLPGGAYQKYGVKLGDMALVRNTDNGRMAVAVFADVGPRNKTGEGSMQLAREMGLNPSPTKGGTSKPSIEYLVLPNTHGTKPRNEQELMARIAEQRRKYGIS